MVVVGAPADDVGVVAGRQVEPLHGAELLEDFERPEDRRAPDAEAARARLGEEVAGREVRRRGSAIKRRQPPARLGQPIAGAIKDQRWLVPRPRPDRSTIETVSQQTRPGGREDRVA